MESEFRKQYFEGLRQEELIVLSENDALIQAFRAHCKTKGVELGMEHFHYSHTKGITAEYPGLTEKMFPLIEMDKEGLFDFNELTNKYKRTFFSAGYLDAGNCWLMAHPYFRRGLRAINNWAPKFIFDFWSLNDPKIEAFISLDPDRLKIDLYGGSYHELDTWHGARFKKDIAQIPDGLVHIRPPGYLTSDDIYSFFACAHSLDIQWGSKPGIRVFEAEEFKTKKIKLEKDGITYHPVRYLHAEFDIDKGSFRHFDGAVHFYTEEEYDLRVISDMNYNAKNARQIKTLSQKLFKFNGDISVDVWMQFASQFLPHNPLVFEYFEGDYPPYLLEKLEIIKNRK